MFPDHWGLTGGAGHRRRDAGGDGAARGARGDGPDARQDRAVPGLLLRRDEDCRRRAPRREDAPPTTSSTSSTRPATTPAEELVCGEGRELRFFSPDETAGIDIAYNHREVLADFFASSAYALYLRGVPFGDAGRRRRDRAARALPRRARRRHALVRGADAGDRALGAARRDRRRPRSTATSSAAKRSTGCCSPNACSPPPTDACPQSRASACCSKGRAPAEPDRRSTADGAAARITDDRLRALIGESKHRAHLNYLYGVTVEEALQYAVELEVSKERLNVNIKDRALGRGGARPHLRAHLRPARAPSCSQSSATRRSSPNSPNISLAELREFMYWLFKFRVKNQEPARVASDTRKALAQLSAMEVADPPLRSASARNPPPEARRVLPHAVSVPRGVRLRAAMPYLQPCPRPHRHRPRVFVTRLLPGDAVARLARDADVDQWTDELPPPYDELVRRTAERRRHHLPAHGPHRRSAPRRRAAPARDLQRRRRLRQHRRRRRDRTRHPRRQHARRAHRDHRRPRVRADPRLRAPHRRSRALRARRALADVGSEPAARPRRARRDARHRRLRQDRPGRRPPRARLRHARAVHEPQPPSPMRSASASSSTRSCASPTSSACTCR